MIDSATAVRLLRGTPGTPLTLAQHEATFPGTMQPASLLAELGASGLTGRGGASFPTADKAHLLAGQKHRVMSVVVNAMEGEPASRKDATLLNTNPHLVLDGAEALGWSVGTDDVIICVAQGQRAVIDRVQRAVDERRRRDGHGARFVIQTPPGRYVAGEESALTHWLGEHESLPLYRPHRPSVPTVRQRPVLVDNAETCAHVGLIARYGAEWFRAVGTESSPGSTLVTVSGAVEHPAVLEVALGTPIRRVLDTSTSTAVLLGGYGGSWLDGSLLDLPYANESLGAFGASVGAGVIVALGDQGCGIAETARITKWMAAQNARQCGPCTFGLPALAADLGALVSGSPNASGALARLEERCEVIAGRGACRHPDGVVRLVRSALEVFRDDAMDHANGRPCYGASSNRHYARVPGIERAKRTA